LSPKRSIRSPAKNWGPMPRRGSRGPAIPVLTRGLFFSAGNVQLGLAKNWGMVVYPGPVLQPAGLEHGFEALWAPVAVFPHAGCHQDFSFCTQVCPTGALRPLSLADKRRFVIVKARV
jgi:hypothetical protein